MHMPEIAEMPQHIAIVMDGNGRWAMQHKLPRVKGHIKGIEAVRGIVKACAQRGVAYLTLFAFSSENWRRPGDEVSFLMRLFVNTLEREIDRLHTNGIRLRIVGNLSMFEPQIQTLVRCAEMKTATNERMTLTIAANYGGRWDIVQAAGKLAEQALAASRRDFLNAIDETDLSKHLAMAYAPEPDLFIRTGGEQRVSNFLLWQLAYTELYFTDVFWPDFDADALDLAIDWYRRRERRFGRTSAQIRAQPIRKPEAQQQSQELGSAMLT